MLTQSSAGQDAGLPSTDLELVNYGAGYGWFRRELDAAIADADACMEKVIADLRACHQVAGTTCSASAAWTLRCCARAGRCRGRTLRRGGG